MRIPLLFLTLALSAAGEMKPDGGPGPDDEARPWPRPEDREPADDWSERTGIPSPFPCRAEMVWCDSYKTDRLNPDGTDHGTWVPTAGWYGPDDPRASTLVIGRPPAIEGAIGVYTLEATAREVVSVLNSQFIEARVVPVGEEFAVFVHVQHIAVATVDTAPLHEAAEQLAETAGEALAAVDEVAKEDGEPA